MVKTGRGYCVLTVGADLRAARRKEPFAGIRFSREQRPARRSGPTDPPCENGHLGMLPADRI
jgi:hypothetical protein